MNTINMVPEFTGDSPVEGTEEAVQPAQPTEEPVVKEKETPAETPAEEVKTPEQKPVEPVPNEPVPSGDISNLENQVQGLQNERIKLIKEVQGLRGHKRELKQGDLVQTKPESPVIEGDTPKGVHPDDARVINQLLSSKGFVTQEQSKKMLYESIKQDEVSKFIEKFPEYKPTNDPNDINWNALQGELDLYRLPSDARAIGDLLVKAHNTITKVTDDGNLEVKKQQLKTAGVGASGVQESSSRKTFDPEKRIMLKRGGWSDEEIDKMESRL